VKTALITGATSGIGKATAFLFAQHNIHLILTGRRTERLEALKKEIELKHPVNVQVLAFDVQSKESCIKAIDKIQGQAVDYLINNAGLSLGLDFIQDGNWEDWDTMIDTNVKGLLYITKLCIPLLSKTKNPHIVNISSIAGLETYPKGNVYCASKHAVNALNKAMRIDLLEKGIKVSAVHPGAVETEFSEVRFKGDKDRAKQVYKGFVPLRPEDIAQSIWWVCSQPEHVNINDLVIMPKAQANSTTFFKVD
jgi:3-hydroxy acid dehydrogenase / malonic semialdehyde reductase